MRLSSRDVSYSLAGPEPEPRYKPDILIRGGPHDLSRRSSRHFPDWAGYALVGAASLMAPRGFDPGVMPSARAARRKESEGRWAGIVYGAIIAAIGITIFAAVILGVHQR